jgi:hypothetical protein
MNILNFLTKFHELRRKASASELTSMLQSSVIESGSDTEDNRECASMLKVSLNQHGEHDIVCAISGESLADICWSLEDQEVVDAICSAIDDKMAVSSIELSSVLRFITLLITTATSK